ncbi:MAG: hypothetical protein SF162_13385 [bacterium]|nr:hypothetical protein [bacterium]
MFTSQEAYITCHRFLQAIWEANSALYDNDLPGLLGDMQLTTDGTPFDPALKNDWREATLEQDEMSVEFAFDSMLRFLKIYVDLGEAETNDITRVIFYINSNEGLAFAKWIELTDRFRQEEN